MWVLWKNEQCSEALKCLSSPPLASHGMLSSEKELSLQRVHMADGRYHGDFQARPHPTPLSACSSVPACLPQAHLLIPFCCSQECRSPVSLTLPSYQELEGTQLEWYIPIDTHVSPGWGLGVNGF